MVANRLPALVVVATLALGGCGSARTSDGFELQWAQREDEAGKLPVGLVVEVREGRAGAVPTLSESAPAGLVGGASVKPSIGAIATATSGHDDRVWRHVVRLRGGTSGVFETAQPFPVGTCVAVRPRNATGYAALGTALPGQCD